MATAVIVIIVLVVLGWMVFTQGQARQQVDVSSHLSAQEAALVTRKYFGPAWTLVDGPGQFNYRPKLRKAPPIISITITPPRTAVTCRSGPPSGPAGLG